MAATWQYALCICMLLMESRGQNPASDVTTMTITNFSSGTEVAPGSDAGNNSSQGATTLAVVSWRWEHVSTPYLVALWVLVSWLCKFGESVILIINVI